jgi:diguanylate cyclase (GGDEF)-like protein
MIDVRFKVPRRAAITLSGDAPSSPSPFLTRISTLVGRLLQRSAADSGGPGDRGNRRRARIRLRRSRGAAHDVRVVLALVFLALVPLVLATWTFGRAFRSSETARADARLAAALRIAADRTAAASTTALQGARALAASRAVQRALVRRDGAALKRFDRQDGALSISVLPAGRPSTPASYAAVVRQVSVRGPAGPIGRVVASVGLSDLLRAAASQTGTSLSVSRAGLVQSGALQGWRVGGPAGTAFDLRFRGQRYRVLQQLVAPAVGIVAVLPRHAIDHTVRRRQLLTLGAGALTVAALALAGLVVLPRRRQREPRSPLSLVGDAVAAAHDPRALLPVILETTVAGTGAAGGRLLSDGEVVATLGVPVGIADPLVLPLDNEEEGRNRLLVLYPPRRGFTAADRELAHSLAVQGRIALENAVLHSVVRRQAVTDELTDLANRRRFMEALQQDVARSDRFAAPLSLVLFDLDHFKEINDRCGHQTGDDVLRSAAAVIRARVRETDLAARVGGEEFAVIVPGTELSGAALLAENLRRDLAEQVEVADLRGTVTASFGVAAHRSGESAELLIGAADRALYRAKAEGRNRVCLEEPEAHDGDPAS